MTHADIIAAFLAEIIADPDADGPRLTFADWCEEHGQGERAELIRVQVEIAKITSELQSDEDCEAGFCVSCDDRRKLNRRAYELLTQHEPDWAGEFMPGARWTYATSDRSFTFQDSGQAIFNWHRGFIRQAECTFETWRGRQCSKCIHLSTMRQIKKCPDCQGSQLTGGIGPQLVRRAPIEAVVVTDKRPFIDGQREHDFCWQRMSVTERAWDQRNYPHRFMLALPNDLYDYVEGTDTGTQRAKYYPSAAAANTALSAALLQEARETPLTDVKEKVYS